MKKIPHKIHRFLVLVIAVGFIIYSDGMIAQGEKEDEDPLKNTKALVKKGHKSLYDNGAFPVGSTSLKFIPPAKESEIYLQGRRFSFAQESFQENLKRASESVVVLKEGHGLTYRLSKELSTESIELSKSLRDNMILPGIYVMGRSQADALGITGRAWTKGLENYKSISEQSENMRYILLESGIDKRDALEDRQAKRKIAKEEERIQELKRKKREKILLEQEIYEETGRFLIGYTELGSKTKTRTQELITRIQEEDPVGNLKKWEGIRKKLSSETLDGLANVWTGIGDRVGSGFRKAMVELESVQSGAGLSLAILKSSAIIAKTLFLDAVIVPIGETVVHSVGYVVVNTVAYPVGIVTISGKSVAVVLVEVVDVAGSGVVDLVAPTGRLALAGMIGGGRSLSRGLEDTTKKTFSAVEEKVEDSSERLGVYGLYGAGFITEASGKYLIAPVGWSAGVAEETITGIGSYTFDNITGASMAATGSVLSLATFTGGQAGSGAVYVGGTTITTATAGAFSVYYVGKAVGIPIGVSVGSGVVMSYEMVAQLGAHTILAAADMTYLVLSLEGGRWVLYGVKQTGKKAGMVVTGSMLDLDAIREEGGEVVRIPVSDEEMERVLKEVDREAEDNSQGKQRKSK